MAAMSAALVRPARPLRLGLPAWAFAPWRGPYFPKDVQPLASYARVFDTVEGNITFYTLPAEPTVARWRELLAGHDFRFCFKLPREVTHGGMAREGAVLRALFARLEPVGEHCGPFMIQLPARIGPSDLGSIEALLSALPRAYRYALEVRHPEFFRAPARLFDLLARHECGRVLLDSRPIHGNAPPHPDLEPAAVAHEKPDLPVLWQGPETLRIVRFVAHPLLSHDLPYLQAWATHLAGWLAADDGREVHVMVHCPNDAHCPPLARAMHETLRASLAEVCPLAPLPEWPAKSAAVAPEAASAQLGFSFD